MRRHIVSMTVLTLATGCAGALETPGEEEVVVIDDETAAAGTGKADEIGEETADPFAVHLEAIDGCRQSLRDKEADAAGDLPLVETAYFEFTDCVEKANKTLWPHVDDLRPPESVATLGGTGKVVNELEFATTFDLCDYAALLAAGGRGDSARYVAFAECIGETVEVAGLLAQEYSRPGGTPTWLSTTAGEGPRREHFASCYEGAAAPPAPDAAANASLETETTLAECMKSTNLERAEQVASTYVTIASDAPSQDVVARQMRGLLSRHSDLATTRCAAFVDASPAANPDTLMQRCRQATEAWIGVRMAELTR